MVEALLDDELAYQAAIKTRYRRMSGWKTVAIYRVVSAVHLQGAFVLMLIWWTHVRT